MKNLLPLLVVVVLFFSCKLKEDRRLEREKTVFRYNESAGITTLDPAYVRRFEDFLAIEQLYNGLVSLNDKSELVPAIAKSWSVSDNGLTYTFKLREDVFFNESELFGKKKTRRVTANDFLYSFLRILDPTTASPGRYIFENLNHSLGKFSGVIAKDENTLILKLSAPQPSLIYQLSLPYCSVVPHEVVEYYKDDFSTHAIGTGPFYLKKWKKNVKMILAKNINYFEKDQNGIRLPYLDAISIYFIQDKHQEFLKFRAGNLEMISGVNEEDRSQLLTPDGELAKELKGKFILQKTDWLNTEYLGILMEKQNTTPLQSKLVRQAIGYAINREEMIRYLRNGIGTPANKGFIPKGMPNFEQYTIEGFNYDIEKARKLIKKAGYNEVNKIPIITLSATPEYKNLCEYLQQKLERIGLSIKVDINSVSSMNQRIAQFKANFYRKSWIADFPDAINYFQLFYSHNFYPEFGSNYTHFSNKEYDSLYELAMEEKNENARHSLYRKLNRILHNEAPVIPLFYAKTLRFLKINVKGLKSNTLNMLSLKSVKL